MGKLYDNCRFLISAIEAKGLDAFRARGAVALETGFLISGVTPEDPDDPDRLRALSDAARVLFEVELPA